MLVFFNMKRSSRCDRKSVNYCEDMMRLDDTYSWELKCVHQKVYVGDRVQVKRGGKKEYKSAIIKCIDKTEKLHRHTVLYEDGSVENNVTRDYIKFVQQTSQDKPTQEVVNEQDIVARVVAENLSENILLENNTLRAEVKMLRSRLNALTKSLPRKRKVINAFDKMMSAAVTQPKKIVTQQQREDKKSSSSHGDVCSRGKRAVANKACIISHLISTHVFAYHTHITV